MGARAESSATRCGGTARTLCRSACAMSAPRTPPRTRDTRLQRAPRTRTAAAKRTAMPRPPAPGAPRCRWGYAPTGMDRSRRCGAAHARGRASRGRRSQTSIGRLTTTRCRRYECDGGPDHRPRTGISPRQDQAGHVDGAGAWHDQSEEQIAQCKAHGRGSVNHPSDRPRHRRDPLRTRGDTLRTVFGVPQPSRGRPLPGARSIISLTRSRCSARSKCDEKSAITMKLKQLRVKT
jgi:hypothetical protein